MGILLPSFAYNPDPSQYKDVVYTNAYAWLICGGQQVERPSASSVVAVAKIYRSRQDFLDGLPPLQLYSPPATTDELEIGRLVYGVLDPSWTVPQAPNPLNRDESGNPITGPLAGLKLLTAYLLRNDPVLGQAGATWD